MEFVGENKGDMYYITVRFSYNMHCYTGHSRKSLRQYF